MSRMPHEAGLVNGLYRVVTPRFVAGFVVSGGTVVACAPCLRRNLYTKWIWCATRIANADGTPAAARGATGSSQ